jgi:alkylhydroperoxidase/carboxymuconolactone decarboxylase family protein YurZ
MDEKTSLLISLGASTAVNCMPCFEHYHKKALAAGLASEEILEAVELAGKVKNGAHTVIRSFIKNLVGQEKSCASCSGAQVKDSCCG